MVENRFQLMARLHKLQGGVCFIGEEPLDLAKDKLEIDHIIPRAKGGKDDENNYAVTCEFHNRNKSDSDLRIARRYVWEVKKCLLKSACKCPLSFDDLHFPSIDRPLSSSLPRDVFQTIDQVQRKLRIDLLNFA